MASTVFSSSALKAKFRGCLIGVLLGDCLGTQFDHRAYISRPTEEVVEFVTKLMNEDSTKTLRYSDDTAMTLAIASSLIDKGEVNAKDIAERFVNRYFKDNVRRGYGAHVIIVFHKLKYSSFEDVFLPARQQFDGAGSYGNGAAMRTAPIGLFGNGRGEDYIMKAAKECALITHAHRKGYKGAILQCLAVSAALELDSSLELDPIDFIDYLLEKMMIIEKEDNKPYCKSLKKMKNIFYKNQEDISPEKIAESLGNGDDLSAIRSVPPAIYSFLRSTQPLQNYPEITNPFLRTIYFAIFLGGDTDTIAAMAGALAGAYYGQDMIPDALQKRCESVDEVISIANKLHTVTYKTE